MTIDEKIGQLVQYNANIIMDTPEDVTGPRLKSGLSEEQINNIGSVFDFKTPLEVRAIQDKLLENEPHKIPMLFMMDVIHGFRTIFSDSVRTWMYLYSTRHNQWVLACCLFHELVINGPK